MGSPCVYSSMPTEIRRLFPDAIKVDPVDAYGRLRRVGIVPRARLNIVARVDGAVSLAGHFPLWSVHLANARRLRL
jgi:hypothetical protein